MPIKWRKTQRKRLNGPRHPHKADLPEAAFDAQRGWAWLRARRAAIAPWYTLEAIPRFQPLVDAIVQGSAADAPPTELDLDVETLRIALAIHEHSMTEKEDEVQEASLRAVAGCHLGWFGFEGVWRLYHHEAPFVLTGGYCSDGTTDAVVTDQIPSNWGTTRGFHMLGHYRERSYMNGLRASLYAADDATWRAARAAAEPVWESLMAEADALGVEEQIESAREMPAGRKRDAAFRALYPSQQEAERIRSQAAKLAYVFARDPRWAAEHARRQLHPRWAIDSDDTRIVLASLTDAELAAQLVTARYFNADILVYSHIYDLVENLGADAVTVFQAIQAKGVRMDSRSKRTLASAIRLAQSG